MTIQSLQLMTIAILTASNRTFINMIKHYKCPKCEAALGIDSSTTKPVKCPKCNHLGALNEFQPLALATHKCLNCNHTWKNSIAMMQPPVPDMFVQNAIAFTSEERISK